MLSHKMFNPSGKGDVKFTINTSIKVAAYRDITFQNGSIHTHVSDFATGDGYINFEIPQSDWIKNMLPQLGHDSFRLIELPGTSQVIPTEYASSLKELEAAKKYFLNGDFDKTVGHCRSAIEPFKPKKDQIKTFIKYKSELSWANDILEATDTWLLRLVRSTSQLTSKPHHMPSVGHFDRTEAEIIMMATTAIIAYIGKLENSNEEN